MVRSLRLPATAAAHTRHSRARHSSGLLLRPDHMRTRQGTTKCNKSIHSVSLALVPLTDRRRAHRETIPLIRNGNAQLWNNRQAIPYYVRSGPNPMVRIYPIRVVQLTCSVRAALGQSWAGPLLLKQFHSAFNASTGLTDAARRAGTKQAVPDTRINRAVTPT